MTGEELAITRLESPSGTAIEGRFTFGWIGRLSPEQLAFVGLLMQHRANLQRVATALGVSYNTVRTRMDDVVAALGDARGTADAPSAVLDRLASGELSVDEAVERLRGGRKGR